ncbi:MAG: hypothetical protein R3F08_04170 [Dokdonella sp.]
MQKVLPAYFRSQRQIIIDTETLIGERTSLAADTFTVEIDSIGVDQKILRLRYGQFLGEEFEVGAGRGRSCEAATKSTCRTRPTRSPAITATGGSAEPAAGFGRAIRHPRRIRPYP